MTEELPGVVRMTQDLVRIRSVNDPEAGTAESVAAELVADVMRSFGWPVEVTEVAPNRPNVVAVIDGGGGPGPTLMFEGHTDVVTEGALQAWTVDPFGGDIVDGKLYGRGSADMKSGVAAMIFAARELQLAGPFPGRIVVGALVDEEGMMLGAKHFATTPLAGTVDAAIICEPEAGEICTSAKGALRLRVDLHGVMAHGAMPHQARNPVLCVGPLIAAVADYEAELSAKHGEHPHLGHVYVTPTVLAAGSPTQINVIPADAQVYLDIRTIPGVEHGDVIARIGELAAAAGAPTGVDAAVVVIDNRPAVEIAEDHALVSSMVAAHETVTGEPARFGGVPGTTDGTVLTRDAGIPSIVYGPGGKWIAHQADEFVEVADVIAAMNVYVEAARRFLGAP